MLNTTFHSTKTKKMKKKKVKKMVKKDTDNKMILGLPPLPYAPLSEC